MRLFSERNPALIAVVGTLALVVLFFLTFFSSALPVIGNGTTYTAYFRESAGLNTSSEVRVAGVKVGQVTDVRLEGTKVRVRFTAGDAWMGDRSVVAIKLKTLLGQKYLQVTPEGDGRLDPDKPIPLDRTTVPYDIAEASARLVETQEAINVKQLAEGFRSLSRAFDGTPADVRRMLDGLSGLADTVASRDDELARLMRNMRDVTGVVAGVDTEVERLLADGDLLLGELDRRRAAMTELLKGTRALAHQLSGLVRESRAQLAPTLKKLDKVSAILVDNRKHIEDALKVLGPYYSLLTDSARSGNWVDAYLCGLFDGDGRPVLDKSAQRTCNPKEWSR